MEQWLRNRYTWVGLGLCAAAFVVGALVLALGPSRDGELALDTGLASLHNPLGNLASDLVNVGDGPIVAPAFLAIVCLALAGTRRLSEAILVGLTTGIGWISAAAPKIVLPRPRPGAAVNPLYLETARDSFPSGHVAFVAALTLAVVVIVKLRGRRAAWWALAGTVVVLVVAFMRLYAGVHYLGDVIASPLLAVGSGLFLGSGYAWLARWVAARWPAWSLRSPRELRALAP